MATGRSRSPDGRPSASSSSSWTRCIPNRPAPDVLGGRRHGVVVVPERRGPLLHRVGVDAASRGHPSRRVGRHTGEHRCGRDTDGQQQVGRVAVALGRRVAAVQVGDGRDGQTVAHGDLGGPSRPRDEGRSGERRRRRSPPASAAPAGSRGRRCAARAGTAARRPPRPCPSPPEECGTAACAPRAAGPSCAAARRCRSWRARRGSRPARARCRRSRRGPRCHPAVGG